MFGVDINYFLTDALWIGLQGQYFVKQLTTQAELVGLQFNRTSTMNRYLYGGAFNIGYVPVYGKFALFNRSIIHWEIWASVGVGATFTEVIARDPAEQNKAFKNTALTVAPGIGTRIFLIDWLTFNFAIRDYIIAGQVRADHGLPGRGDEQGERGIAAGQQPHDIRGRRDVPAHEVHVQDASLTGSTRGHADAHNKHRFALLIALATVSLPLAAQAQRKSPLADAPAIRKRFELRSTRLELGVGGGSTVNQDFYHTVRST